jgi:hypothetical protein
MDRGQLVDALSTNLLWEVVCAYVENINQLPIILKDIAYVEDIDNVIAQITKCEVLDSEHLEIKDFWKLEESILISFEMQFVLSVWSRSRQLLRITAVANGKCRIPDIGKYDWKSIDFEDMDKEELLSYEGLVDILELNYPIAECDDVSMFN